MLNPASESSLDADAVPGIKPTVAPIPTRTVKDDLDADDAQVPTSVIPTTPDSPTTNLSRKAHLFPKTQCLSSEAYMVGYVI